MKIKSAIKNLGMMATAAAFAGASMLFSGCRASKSIIEYKSRGGQVYAGVSARGGWTPTYYDLKLKESKEVPVHPDDAGFLYGTTSVKAGGGLDILVCFLGLEGAVGTKNAAFVGGMDVQFNGTEGGGSYDMGGDWVNGTFYKRRQQSSDQRPKSSGSFVYDKITPGIVSPAPFAGARVYIDEVCIGAEVHARRMELEREWGHHRFNHEEKVGSEKDAAWGVGPTFSVSGTSSESTNIGVYVSCEAFNFKKMGRMYSFSAGVNLNF